MRLGKRRGRHCVRRGVDRAGIRDVWSGPSLQHHHSVPAGAGCQASTAPSAQVPCHACNAQQAPESPPVGVGVVALVAARSSATTAPFRLIHFPGALKVIIRR